MAKPILIVYLGYEQGQNASEVVEYIKKATEGEYHVITKVCLSPGPMVCINPDNVVGTVDVNDLIEKISKA